MKSKYELLLKLQKKIKNWTLGEKVVFHHVPKCGGTSLNRALRLRYMASQRPIMANSSAKALSLFYPGIEDDPFEFHRKVHLFRKQLLHYYLSADISYITGHVGFCASAFNAYSASYRFVSVLRHPVDRFISDYLDLSVRGASYYRTDLSIEEYLETEEAEIRANTLCLYFSSSDKSVNRYDSEDLKLAQANIEKLDLVGFVDDMPRFNRELNSLLGIRIKVGHENKSLAGSSDKRDSFSQNVISKINRLCERDVELYEKARSLR